MAADHAVLVQIALTKLRSNRPEAWDTDGRALFEAASRQAYRSVNSDELEAAWRDGLITQKRENKSDWDEYAKISKNFNEITAVAWEKVLLLRGQTDGDNFELHFNVDGAMCLIECTDVQLLDPHFILRKLVMYTAKDIACPYLSRKQLDAWRRNVVIPWLRSEAFSRVEREIIGDQVEDLIREYCERSLDGTHDESAWKQTKRAIVDKGFTYIPFTGLQEFVSKRMPSDMGKKSIKNVMDRLGFTVTKKGKDRLRFHSINTNILYVEPSDKTDPGETGNGEVHPDRDEREGGARSGADRILDDLREEKRTRPSLESGPGTAIAEGQEITDHLSDDPLDALPGT